MDVAHRWHPIRDYQVDPAALVQSELTPLTALWREQRAQIEASGALRRFNEQLGREWAIETGLIERVCEFGVGASPISEPAAPPTVA